MSEETTYTALPALRFPEFEDAGRWELKRLGEVLCFESSTLAQNKLELQKQGFEVYGASGFIGYLKSYAQKERYIAILKDGSGVGRITIHNAKSSILGTMGYLKSKDLNTSDLIWSYYMLQSLDLRSYIKGSGIPHLYYSDYEKHELLIPSLAEQQKIASCLSSLDDLIAAASAKLDALKAHKRGLMQVLFPAPGETVPRLRFPEFADAGEWEEKKLGEVCENIFSGQDKHQENGIYKLYGSTGVIGNTEKATLSGKYILVARVGANAGQLNLTTGTFGVTDNTLIVKPVKFTDTDFLYYLLSNFGLTKLVFGSGQPLITGGQLKGLPISLPVGAEKQKIAACLSTQDELIEAQAGKVEALKAHKRGLMQGLFPAAG